MCAAKKVSENAKPELFVARAFDSSSPTFHIQVVYKQTSKQNKQTVERTNERQDVGINPLRVGNKEEEWELCLRESRFFFLAQPVEVDGEVGQERNNTWEGGRERSSLRVRACLKFE